MDNETAKKIRNAIDNIEEALDMPTATKGVITGWLREMRSLLPAPPKTEPAVGPYHAEDGCGTNGNWVIYDATGKVIATVYGGAAARPTAQHMAASWAMRDLLKTTRAQCCEPTVFTRLIDDLFREYGL